MAAARRTLFGAWESDWIAWNDARDVRLPGSTGPAIAFLMYPQAETAAGRFDCLAPEAFPIPDLGPGNRPLDGTGAFLSCAMVGYQAFQPPLNTVFF